MDSLGQSTDIIEKLTCTDCVGQELNAQADHYRRQRMWDDALELAQISFDLCRQGNHMRSLGIAQMQLGAIHHARGALREAARLYEDSLDSFVYDRRNRSIAWLAIARTKQKLGEWKSVIEAYQFSLEILKGLDQDMYNEILGEYQQVIHSLPPKTLPLLSQSEKGGKEIPIVARVAAGEPLLAEENIEGHILVDDELAEQADFALRVEGDSMVEATILDGNLVLMQQRTDPPPNGRIVAATVTQMDTESTLKRFYDEGDHARLEPANDDYPFIIITADAHIEDDIRTRYKKSHPKRHLQFYSGAAAQISGWAIALIREDIR